MARAKSHPTEAVTGVNGFTKKKCSKAVTNFHEIIKPTPAACDDVMISAISKFSENHKLERKG